MKALPRGDGGGELPHRDHRREVERRDAGHDAQRLAHRIDVDARAGAFGVLALQHLRRADAELDHFEAALDVALGVGNGLAVLARQEVGERVVVARGEFEELHHHARAALRVGGGPGGLRGLGVLDGGAHLGRRWPAARARRLRRSSASRRR